MLRAFTSHELAARAWWYTSLFPDERGLAAQRFRETAPACADEDLRLHVVLMLAIEGFHARAITADVVRDRAAWLVQWGGYDGEIVQLGVDLVHDAIARLAQALRMTYRNGDSIDKLRDAARSHRNGRSA